MGCLQSTTLSKQNYINECVICCSASSNVMLIPCGHHQICNTCAFRLLKMVPKREVKLTRETNKYFKNITCPICFQSGGLIKMFSNRTEGRKCSVCKTIVNAFIIPCCCKCNICYECCLDFVSNGSEHEISLSSEFSIVCPVCRREGTFKLTNQ